MPSLTRDLTPRATLESLRKQAKRFLKDIEAGDPVALDRFRDAFPNHTAKPVLREAQHALAHEYGFASWAALKQEIEDRQRTHADRVRLFLEKSAIRYSTAPGTLEWNTYEPDRPYRGQLAARLLARHPGIARESIHTAVAAGDIDAVQGFLARDPSLAAQRGGPDNWPPLLRLAYTRLPVAAASANAVAIARMLLDAGASPHAAWADGHGFTTLTGAVGGGEGGQPAHPQAEALARLLVERGADPLDGQALYNTSLGADDTFWLDLLWAETERRGEAARWHAEIPGVIGPPLEYLLGNAVPNHPVRAAWLLDHGAPASAVNGYSKRPVVRDAALAGRQDVVDLLVRHGASPPQLSDPERLVTAATMGDAAEARRLAALHPELLQRPEPMFAAIRAGRRDMVEILLDLGAPPGVAGENNFTALHLTTHCGEPEIAKLLIARGAEIDPFETLYGGTPISHASYGGRADMVALLAAHSRNIRGLCFAGCVDRLRELLAEDPGLANEPIHDHEPPLFCLPDEDEDKAMAVAELLLSFGADRSATNAEGLTPAEAARKRGLEEAAALLDDAVRG